MSKTKAKSKKQPTVTRDRIKDFRRVLASELLPNPKNWRTHPEKQQAALRAVLDEIGYADALIARELPSGQLMLVDGHLRAETTPHETVPVLVLDVSEAEADKLLVSLDPLAALAGANKENLDSLLRSVQTGSEDLANMLTALGKSAGLLQASEATDDEVPEKPTEPITKTGDLWLLGEHRLLCGDSTNGADVERLLAGASPFIMVTDPPYGVEYDGDWRDDFNTWGKAATARNVQNDHRVDWTEAYKLFPGHVAYVWHADRFAAELVVHLRDSRFEIRTQIIWKKPRFAMSRGHYHWQHEPCWYAVRKGGSSKWCGDRTQSTVWEITGMHAIGRSEEREAHPTQKPVECMARPIRNHGGKDDDVYDPFCGSGTTIVAAEQLGRRCFGMELEPAYCDVVVERWQELTGRKAKVEHGTSPRQTD